MTIVKRLTLITVVLLAFVPSARATGVDHPSPQVPLTQDQTARLARAVHHFDVMPYVGRVDHCYRSHHQIRCRVLTLHPYPLFVGEDGGYAVQETFIVGVRHTRLTGTTYYGRPPIASGIERTPRRLVGHSDPRR